MEIALVVFVDVLYSVAALALISVGLAVVFGVMRVINLAHGEFLTIGGYTTIVAVNAGVNVFFAMLVIAPLMTGIVGLLVERLVIRFLYGRMLDTMLATWGLSLFFVGLLSVIFGNTTTGVSSPIGGITIGSYQVSGYNLFVIVIAVVLLAAIYALLRYSHWGLVARGTMDDPEMAAAFGYRPSVVYMTMFSFGAAITGLAGGVLAPIIGLVPSSGSQFIAKAFITVISGGPAVMVGILSGSIFYGVINQVVSLLSTPAIGELALLVVAIVLLRLLPTGITGRFFRHSQ